MFFKATSVLAILSLLAVTQAAPVDERDDKPQADPKKGVQLTCPEWTSCWSLDKADHNGWGGINGLWQFFFNDKDYGREHFNYYRYKLADGDKREWDQWRAEELVKPEDAANKADTKYDCTLQCNDKKVCLGQYTVSETDPFLGLDQYAGAVDMQIAGCKKL